MNLEKILRTRSLLRGEEPSGPLPTDGELLRETLRIAWPSMLESFLVALVGFIDTVMVSGLGTAAIAAVGLTTQPKFICLAVFLSLNVAVSALVARRRGQDDPEKANRVLVQSILITLGLTAVISVAAFALADPILRLAGSAPDTHEDAVAYFRIITAGMVFNTLTMVINAAQRGAGNTRIAMKTNIVANLVNICFNYLLIGGNLGFPELGVRGAAIATVLGTVCACALSIASVLRKDSFINLRSVKGWLPERQSVKSIGNVWSSSLVEQVCLRIGFLLFSMTVARLGTTELAAHQIGSNMMSMSFSFGDGLSVAAITLIGQSLGRQRPDMAKIYGSVCQRLGLCCACVMGFIYFFFGKEIFLLYSNDPVILDYGAMIMRILSVVLFMQIEQVVQFGCLRGAGDTKFTALVSFISVTFIRPGASWLLCYPIGLGLMGAWLGTALDQLVRFLLTFFRFRKGNWTKLKL